jgi:hypothetical protein
MPKTTAKTKAQVSKENKALKGINPPDKDELRKSLETGDIDPEKAGMEQGQEIKEPENPDDDTTGESGISEKKEPQNESTVPDPQEDFRVAMMQYGFKEGQARIIANHAAQIGGPKVFSNPIKLLEIMNSFPYIGSPPVRKNILDFWIQTHGLVFTEEYQDKSGQEPLGSKQREEKLKDIERAYAFDTSSGNIRQAMEGERGLTLAAAEELKAKWRADHPITNETDKEPKMIQDTNGNWMLNPNAKNLTPGDIAYLEGLRPKPDSLDIMAMGEEKRRQLQESLGIKPGGSPDMNDRMFTLIQENMKLQMAQANTVMADALKAMTAAIEKLGTKTEDPVVAAIREQNRLLLEKLDTEREARHKTELDRRDDEARRLAEEVKVIRSTAPAGSKTEMDVITDIGQDFKNEMSGLRTDIMGFVMKYPPGFVKGSGASIPSDQKKIIISGIKDTIKNGPPGVISEVKQMGKDLFGKG